MGTTGRLDYRRTIAAVLVVAVTAGGCAKSYVYKLAPYEIGQAPVRQAVPRTGVYTVCWTDAAGRALHDVEGTARVLPAGAVVGFAPTTQGSPVALAGDEQLDLS